MLCSSVHFYIFIYLYLKIFDTFCFVFGALPVVQRAYFWFCTLGPLLTGFGVPYVGQRVDHGTAVLRQINYPLYYHSTPNLTLINEKSLQNNPVVINFSIETF